MDLHNIYRCMHDAPPVTWNDAMGEHVELTFKDATEMEHSDSFSNTAAEGGPAGENLYWATQAIPSRAVDKWYSEVSNCGPMPGCTVGSKGTTGHFTAMIWREVRHIACTRSNNGRIIACRYGNGPGSRLSSSSPNMPSGARRNVRAAVKSRS